MSVLQKAALYFSQNGRDIDRARFDYHFDALPLEELLDILGRYQNEDGGFGHALEVDITAPDSNPFATELALMICIQAQVPADNQVLVEAVRYLEETQDDDGSWRFAPGIYEHPLAPWFQGWEWPNLNPSCTTSGLLKQLNLGSDMLHQRVKKLFDKLSNPADLCANEFYSARPYAYYFLPEWDHPEREFYLSGLLWWLVRVHVNEAVEDSGHFFDYVRGPQTYTGSRLPAAILETRLDMLEAEQAGDGAWPSPYNEGWRGWASMQNLLVLKAFGRI